MTTRVSLEATHLQIELADYIGLIPIRFHNKIFNSCPTTCFVNNLRAKFWPLVILLSFLRSSAEIYQAVILSKPSTWTTWNLIFTAFHGFMTFMNFASILNIFTFHRCTGSVCVMLNCLLKSGKQRENCKKPKNPHTCPRYLQNSPVFFREIAPATIHHSSKTSSA